MNVDGSTGAPREVPRVAQAACVAAALVALLALAAIVARRVAFPYPLEWQEAAMLEHVTRSGGIYVAPTVEFAPFPYPPLFHWLGGLVTGAFGESLPVLRSVSIAATLIVLCALAAAATGARRKTSALVAAGVFAGAYAFGGSWYDVARVDMLALAFAAAAYVVASSKAIARGSLVAAAICGLCLAASTLSKQSMFALTVAVPATLAWRGETRRAAAVAAACATIPVLVVFVVMERATGGAFSFTVVDLLAGSPLHGPGVRGYWLEVAPFLAVPLGLWWVAGAKRPANHVTPLTIAALFAIGWVGRSHEGGYVNTLIPAALAGSLGVARTFGDAMQRLPWAATVLALLLASYLQKGEWDVVPTSEERDSAASITTKVEALDGTVWQPGVALTANAGVHRMAIVDLFKSRETEAATAFANELVRALDETRFDAIVLSHDLDEWVEVGVAIGRNYRPAEVLSGYTCRTGAPVGPKAIWVPR